MKLADHRSIRPGCAVTLSPTAWESLRINRCHAVVYHVKTEVKADGTLPTRELK